MGVYKAAVVTENGQHLIAQAFTKRKEAYFYKCKNVQLFLSSRDKYLTINRFAGCGAKRDPFRTKTIGGKCTTVTVRFDMTALDQAI